MGVRELRDERFRGARLRLTEHDVARAEKLALNPVYREVLGEMLRLGVKMEQEVVSVVLGEEGERE